MTTSSPARTSLFRMFVDVTFTLMVIGTAGFFGLKQWNPELLAALPGLSVPAREITDEELEAMAEKPLIPDSAIQNPDLLPESPVSAEVEPEFAQPRFQPPYRQVRSQSPCQQSHQPVYRVVYYRSGGCR